MTTAAEARAQLKELWDNAEQAAPQEGDAFIAYFGEGETQYSIGVARWELDPARYRILERAKPKAPEWEAVVASCIWDEEHHRQAFIRDGQDTWMSADWSIGADDLVDPVPLVAMPSREEIKEALADAWNAWKEDADTEGGADPHRIDALLKLLRGER